ncbi:MAG TPA: zinc-dependent metalloprotease [Actinomycetota bacterium]
MSPFPDDFPGASSGDPMNDVPLFREIQRVLLSSPGPVNWELARQVGIATASWGEDDPAPTEEDGRGFVETVRLAELEVAEFTGLPSPTEIADIQVFRRAQWVEANVRGLREMLEPVAVKLGSALSEAGALPGSAGMFGLPGASGVSGPEAIEGAGGQAELMGAMMQRVAPLLLGAQVGAVLGYLAQRVLGQYDLAVPRESGAVYFVIPNIARFERDWSLPPMDFRTWVALHEVTHRFEFAQPWVRPHFLDLVRDLVEHAELDFSGLEQRMESMDFSDPEALSEAFEGMGNFFGTGTDPEQRLRIGRVQAFMAAAEGYGDHVMESLGRRMLPSFARIEEALTRYREGRHGDQALERLLGLEMKQEQYRLGRDFCDRVVELTDESTLSRMWDSAEALPSMPELEEPSLWLSRMA